LLLNVNLSLKLADTVIPHSKKDGTGFGFSGKTRTEVLENLIAAVKTTKSFYERKPEKFKTLQHRAIQQRFLWQEGAKKYIELLYEPILKMNTD
jgi:glycogen synthase